MTPNRRRRAERRRIYRRRRLGFVCVVALMFLSIGGFSAYLFGDEGGSFNPRTLASTQDGAGERAAGGPEAEKDGPVDVLLLGVDERPGGESEGLGVRADAILIARVDPKTGEARVLSVPRDLYLEISPGERDRINAAYAFGGVEQTRAVIERYTNVGIDHHAVVGFEGFEEGIDALGGIQVDVREGEYPPSWGIEPGEQELDGRRALAYARYRDSAGGDLDRIGHQQQILAAVQREVLSPKTLTKLPQLVEVMSRNVETDVGPSEALTVSRTLVNRLEGRAEKPEVETFQLRGEGTYLEDGRQVLMPDDEENRRILSEFLR